MSNEHAQSCARTGEGVDATTAARRSAKLATVGKDASARWVYSGSGRVFRASVFSTVFFPLHYEHFPGNIYGKIITILFLGEHYEKD
jgi:hypothetical protein